MSNNWSKCLILDAKTKVLIFMYKVDKPMGAPSYMQIATYIHMHGKKLHTLLHRDMQPH